MDPKEVLIKYFAAQGITDYSGGLQMEIPIMQGDVVFKGYREIKDFIESDRYGFDDKGNLVFLKFNLGKILMPDRKSVKTVTETIGMGLSTGYLWRKPWVFPRGSILFKVFLHLGSRVSELKLSDLASIEIFLTKREIGLILNN